MFIGVKLNKIISYKQYYQFIMCCQTDKTCINLACPADCVVSDGLFSVLGLAWTGFLGIWLVPDKQDIISDSVTGLK